MWIVEVIRYGRPELGIEEYGVFDDYELIHPTMVEYNQFRGGEYPAYYVTKIGPVNPKDHRAGWRMLYRVEPTRKSGELV